MPRIVDKKEKAARIGSAAITVFRRLGYHRTRMVDIAEAAAEMRRGGRLLTTYLAHPRGVVQRACVATTLGLRFLTRGLQEIELLPVLERAGFDQIEIAPCPQKGLPVELAGAVKGTAPLPRPAGAGVLEEATRCPATST